MARDNIADRQKGAPKYAQNKVIKKQDKAKKQAKAKAAQDTKKAFHTKRMAKKAEG